VGWKASRDAVYIRQNNLQVTANVKVKGKFVPVIPLPENHAMKA
jgi:hypothetical protein